MGNCCQAALLTEPMPLLPRVSSINTVAKALKAYIYHLQPTHSLFSTTIQHIIFSIFALFPGWICAHAVVPCEVATWTKFVLYLDTPSTETILLMPLLSENVVLGNVFQSFLVDCWVSCCSSPEAKYSFHFIITLQIQKCTLNKQTF
jgi:hypothetical protein